MSGRTASMPRSQRRRILLVLAAAVAVVYALCYFGSSRSGRASSRLLGLPRGQFQFGSILGDPGLLSESGHQVATHAFRPLWKLEASLGGPRPWRPAARVVPAREDLDFTVSLATSYGGAGSHYRVQRRYLTQGNTTRGLSESEAARLRAWWREHDPLTLMGPDIVGPCEDRQYKYPPHRTVLEVTVGDRRRALQWSCLRSWSDPAMESRVRAAVAALEAALKGPAQGE